MNQAPAPANSAFAVTVRLPEPLRRDGVDAIVVDTPVANLRELGLHLESRLEGFSASDELFNFAINGEIVLSGEAERSVVSGDEVELLVAFSGG
jgi:sulfur carrier protein ThiS